MAKGDRRPAQQGNRIASGRFVDPTTGQLAEYDAAAQLDVLKAELGAVERRIRELALPASIRGWASQFDTGDEGDGAGGVSSTHGPGGRVWETGVLRGALFGDFGGEGYPLAFDQPLAELSHDLQVRGTLWAAGYLEEVGGFWRPVVPVPMVLPEQGPPGPQGKPGPGGAPGPQGPPGPPVGKVSPTPSRSRQPSSTPRGRRNLEDPDELTPCDEARAGDPERTPPQPPSTPHARVRSSVRSQPARVPRPVRRIGERPPRPALLGQGRSIIQPLRPAGMTEESDERVRLGGGPWHPEASVVPRGGVRLLDGWDFAAGSTTVFDALNTIAAKTNEIIGLNNDRHPFGPSTLDDAGLYLPPGDGERPRIPGAWDGTLEHTRNGDGQVQAWLWDGGKAYPQAYDHHRLRVVGAGERRDDWLTAIAEHGKSRLGQLRRFGWEARRGAFVFRRLPVELYDGLTLFGPAGGSAELDLESLTDERTLTVPDKSGTLALTSDLVGLDADTLDGLDSTAFLQVANDLSDLASASAARSNLGLAIGSDVQAYDAELAALAGLVSAADKLPYFTGLGTAALTDFTAVARALLDDATTAAQRVTLGLEIGVDVQSYDADTAKLDVTQSWAALQKFPDNLLQVIGSVTPGKIAAFDADTNLPAAATTTFVFPSAGGTLALTSQVDGTIKEADITDLGTTILLGSDVGVEVQAWGPVLDDLNALGANAADGEFLVGTGAGALAWESGTTARASLGLTIGSDVQAYDADLDTVAATGEAAYSLKDGSRAFTAPVDLAAGFALRFGGTTSSFPGLKQVGNIIEVRKADDTGYADVDLGTLTSYDNLIKFAATGSFSLMASNPSSGEIATFQAATGTVALVSDIDVSVQRFGLSDSLTGTLVETTLRTVTIEANKLVAGSTIKVFAQWRCETSAGGGSITARLKIGGTTVATIAMGDGIAPDIEVGMRLRMETVLGFRAVGVSGSANGHTVATKVTNAGGNVREIWADTGVLTLNTTAGIDLVLTGELGNIGDAARLDFVSVEVSA